MAGFSYLQEHTSKENFDKNKALVTTELLTLLNSYYSILHCHTDCITLADS